MFMCLTVYLSVGLPFLLCSNAVKDKSKSGPSGGLLKEENIPPELICSICNELVKEAVIIPCCGESFCDECK